jgi:hypothetical protein
MPHDTLATILWTMLGIMVLLTIVGITVRSAWLQFVAAALSLVFGIASIFSICIVVLALCLTQDVFAVALRQMSSARTTR